NSQLVLDGRGDALHLEAVTEGRVEDLYVHRWCSFSLGLSGATKKPPGGRLDEHVVGPRALGNDDDAGREEVVRVPVHRAPFKRLGGRTSIELPLPPAASWGQRCARDVNGRWTMGVFLGNSEKFGG